MHGHITHFAINADDVGATRAFYEALFGWRFTEAYPGFWRTTTLVERSARFSRGARSPAMRASRSRSRSTTPTRSPLGRRPTGPGADAEVADPGRGRAPVRGGPERERRRSAPSLLTQRGGRTFRAPSPRPSAAAAGQARASRRQRGPHWAGGTSGCARTRRSARDRSPAGPRARSRIRRAAGAGRQDARRGAASGGDVPVQARGSSFAARCRHRPVSGSKR